MEALVVGAVVLASAAATAVFLWAVWRFVLMPSLEGVSRIRGVVVFLAIFAIGVAPVVLALSDVSDRQAVVVIAVVTFLAIGIGIVALTVWRGPGPAARDDDRE